MICFRPFRNNDPPALAKIWRSQPPSRSLAQPMTAVMFDELVLCKPYFDREGLIIAEDDGKPIGFVHAGFDANAAGDGIACERGAICLLLVTPRDDSHEVARALLNHGEQFLIERGSRTIQGGAAASSAAYYFGLYGGTKLPGTLASDEAAAVLYRNAGYHEEVARRIYHRDLAGFRPPVDRTIMQVRRRHQFGSQVDPQPTTWWEAVKFGRIDRVQFMLSLPAGPQVAAARFWDMEPLASSWGVHAMGLVDLEVEPGEQSGPLLTHLLGESLRQLQSTGTTLVEVQVGVDDAALDEACQRLGFREVDQGISFRKTVKSA